MDHGVDPVKPCMVKVQDAPYKEICPPIDVLKAKEAGVEDPNLVSAVQQARHQHRSYVPCSACDKDPQSNRAKCDARSKIVANNFAPLSMADSGGQVHGRLTSGSAFVKRRLRLMGKALSNASVKSMETGVELAP